MVTLGELEYFNRSIMHIHFAETHSKFIEHHLLRADHFDAAQVNASEVLCS
jgi:hypothetical protein